MLLIIDFDGSIADVSSNNIKISQYGTVVWHFLKVPKLVKDPRLLLGNNSSNGSYSVDSDEMLLRLKINERLPLTKEDENEFELRCVVTLPFKCKRGFFMSDGTPSKTYFIQQNQYGYTWALVWLIKDA